MWNPLPEGLGCCSRPGVGGWASARVAVAGGAIVADVARRSNVSVMW